ncbi:MULTISPECIES: hypothetical protein [unclassified Caballeronia]|nr:MULTISPECIES: hypothetical protein [unclassified Caballeronia]MDR5751051.1 hypothetical protein [Caballeronia sp. LZ024]MDR5844814.1 hypothetical protein [Caballeronia sp. LZ031]
MKVKIENQGNANIRVITDRDNVDDAVLARARPRYFSRTRKV